MLDSHSRRIGTVVSLGLAALAASLIAARPAMAIDPAPPEKVREISPATDPSNPHSFTRVGHLTFFAADDGVHGIELWKTDGTPTGTSLVRDIHPGPTNSAPAHLVALNGALIFVAAHPDSGFELWKSDGTLTGTVLISDIVPGPSGFVSDGPVVAGGLGYFKVGTGALRPEGGGSSTDVIYITDGTLAGTRALTPTLNTSASELTAANGLLYFSADDGTHGYELWRSNGLITGTLMISDVFSGPSDANPTEIVGAGSLVYFVADDGVNGPEIFKTTGAPTGTVRVSAFVSNTAPARLTALGTDVYFVGNTAAECSEVWKTDGTLAGTLLAGSAYAGQGLRQPTQPGRRAEHLVTSLPMTARTGMRSGGPRAPRSRPKSCWMCGRERTHPPRLNSPRPVQGCSGRPRIPIMAASCGRSTLSVWPCPPWS
ncbi:MAG: hypothetical protein IPO29_13880 [Anaerolineae bacterium]|nr:hypothetical protein [Anaerolineae bacterium]